MPPPGKPYTPSGAAGISAREDDVVDPDYKFFLSCVRMDGNSYALYIPSKDGVSPPEVIRYEQEEPLPWSNGGLPVAGAEVWGSGGPPPLEENPLAARNSRRGAPYGVASPRAGVKRKAPDANPRAEARSGAVPMEEDPPAPAPEPAWYESQTDMDKDYRSFLQHVVVNEGKAVVKMGNLTIPFGHEPSVDNSGSEEDDDAEEEDEVEPVPASGQSGEDGVGTEDEGKMGAKKAVKEEVVSEEEEDNEESQGEEVDEEYEEWKAEGEVDSEVGPGLDLLIVNDTESEMKDDEVKDEGEKQLSAEVKGITESQPLNREASSSKELQGVIWPPHITERPNSLFKRNLMRILSKPFKQEEYDRYVAMATNRTPVVKERRTRHSVVYYKWKHEMGKSYFDSYPDLAEQFKLQDNNYTNRLALLRGFFFWLQNVGREDQFRPWRDDFKRYRVVSVP